MYQAKNPIKAVQTTLRIIKALEYFHEATITELADFLCVSDGTVHHHLATLYQHRYVVKEGEKYKLSYKFLDIGNTMRSGSLLYIFGKKEADRLADETDEVTGLTTEQHGLNQKVYNARGKNATGNKADRIKTNRTDYLHNTASGKAILAYLPNEYVDTIIEEYGIVSKTENTISDRDELLETLSTIRECGYALNDEEEVKRMRAVGAPILAPDDTILGAISVSGPSSRIKGEYFHEELPEIVINASRTIEMLIDMENDGRISGDPYQDEDLYRIGSGLPSNMQEN